MRMFGSKKQSVSSSDPVGTIIGSDASFKGSINSQGTIRVDGQHEGDITTAGDLVVGENGQLKAKIKARSAIIAGKIEGNVEVADKLELLPTAKIYGDIKVGKLTINEGAVFDGACQMITTVSGTEDE